MGVSRDMVAVSLAFAGGVGVKKDPKAAVEWIMKAVDRGDSRAMGILGKYYHEGIGLDRNDLSAKEWYQKANQPRRRQECAGLFGRHVHRPGRQSAGFGPARSPG